MQRLLFPWWCAEAGTTHAKGRRCRELAQDPKESAVARLREKRSMRKPSLSGWTSLGAPEGVPPPPHPCPPQTPNLGVDGRSPGERKRWGLQSGSYRLWLVWKQSVILTGEAAQLGGRLLPWPLCLTLLAPLPHSPLPALTSFFEPRPGRWRGAGRPAGGRVSLRQSFCRPPSSLLPPPLFSPRLFSADRLQRRSRWISGQKKGSGRGYELLML